MYIEGPVAVHTPKDKVYHAHALTGFIGSFSDIASKTLHEDITYVARCDESVNWHQFVAYNCFSTSSPVHMTIVYLSNLLEIHT